MHGLEISVVIGMAVLLCTALARRWQVAPPVLLLAVGAGLGFVPGLDGVVLPPEVVLLIFLPALLYWEALSTSLREIRANLRVILLLSVVLVLVTAAGVAGVGHALGLSWPVAFVLGAIVAPTDATAVSAVARSMPRRPLTTLRAESLINDGTALVVFAIAVQVATGAAVFSVGSATGRFALSYLGGTAVGVVAAWAAVRARRALDAPLLENGVSVLTPFVAYLGAELIHASGVLAVVVCGLAMSQVGPRVIRAQTRVQGVAFWTLTTFLLNGALFVLVGLQLGAALHGLRSYSLGEAAVFAVIVAATVIGIRLVWYYTVPYLIRALDRRPQQRARRVGARQRLPLAWAGFRGEVSLAAALAVPTTLIGGARFPGRDLLIVITFGVILVTLLVQGLTLPAVLRWAGLPTDVAEGAEQRLAQRTATEAGLAALPTVAARLGVSDTTAQRVRDEYEEHLATLREFDDIAPLPSDGADPHRDHDHQHYARLRTALLADKRRAVIALRDTRRIDDIVLRRVQAQIDAEEVRLAPDHADE
jgi:monovalent cation/hydrogen antiporter